MPEISVCTPCYYVDKYMKERIDIVSNQTFYDFKYVIVEDSSTYTLDIIKKE